MNTAPLAIFLRIAACAFFGASALHLIFGLQADVMLGAKLSAATISDPALDSQNRFYGLAFSLYGFLLLLCARDIEKYSAVLKLLLWVLFAAGMARFISVALYGAPPPLVMGLFAAEVILPPLVLLWLARLEKSRQLEKRRA